MPFSAPVLTYRAKGLASNIQSKVLKVHNTLININITAILAPEMTYTPTFKGVLESRVTQNSTLANTYVLNGSFGNIGFYKYTADYLPKGRAYFEVVSSGVQGFLFDFEGSETTGINAAALSDSNAAKTYYDLSGRRVASPKHGLYICNGKKVYIK